MKVQCNTCQHYDEINDEVGDCRRNPPSVSDLFLANAIHAKPDASDIGHIYLATIYPVVEGSQVCGEYSEKH